MSKKDREANRAERAAAIRREELALARRRRVTVTAVVLAVLAVIVGVGIALSGGGDEPTTTGTTVASVDGQALVLGTNADATKVVVYEDFLCPFCREFEADSRSLLRRRAEQGKVVVEYRPFQVIADEYSARSLSVWAAVAQQGTPQQALRLHDLLFENQPYESDPAKPGLDELVDLAREAGVTDSAVLAAARKPDKAFADAARQHATDANVQGTPTIFVDGEELTGSTIADKVDRLEKLIDQG